MDNGYWSQTLGGRRISRRRALAVAGVGISAAAFLAACGGSGNDNNKEKTGASKLLTKPEDQTGKSVKGGTIAIAFTTEPTDFNPLISAATTSNQTSFVYSRLLKHKVGRYPTAPDGSVEPDAAESWELSPDGTQVTFKLRPNMPFDARPPTSGRALTAADVKYSWDTFAAKNAARSDVSNAVSPNAPIASVTAPDDKTIVVKLAFKYGTPGDIFAWPNYIQIVPREAESGFDPRRESRGSGAWFMQEYKPSSSVTFKRNPQWYVKDRPFLDGIDSPIITEYATGLAQFRTGNLATFPVRGEDILDTKNGVPQLLLMQNWYTQRSSPYNLSFGWKQGSPFIDQRVRQAVSMLLDRDAMLSAINNIDKFQAAGLPVPLRWNSTVPAGDTKYWLDPTGKGLGDAAKFFSHNPAEAKKLLAAAGNTGPIKTKYSYTTNGYAEPYVRQAEIMRGMLTSEKDFDFEVQALDYQSAFRYGYSDVTAAEVQKLEGIYVPGPRPAPNIDFYLFTAYHSQGSKVKYWPPDAAVDDLILKQRAETDEAKRISLVQDLQKSLTAKMYSVPYDGSALGFTLTWPWVQNAGFFGAYASAAGAGIPAAAGAPQESLIYLAYDATKKT